MLKKMVLIAAVMGLIFSISCRPKTQTVEQAYQVANDSYDKAATPEEKIRIVRDFLHKYPESSHTRRMVTRAIYHYSEQLKKPAEAWDLILTVEAALKDPKILREVQVTSLEVLGKLKKVDDLESVVAKLAEKPLKYDEHMAVSNAFVEAGRWNLALDHSQAAFKFATPDSVKADSPGQNFTPEDLAFDVKWRKQESLTNGAWAQANLGQFPASLKTFEESRSATVFSFVGASMPPTFDLYLGRTYLMQNQFAKAVEVLTPAAVFAGDAEAREALKTAFKGLKKTEAGFDVYLEEQRVKLSKSVTDFSLPDYDGKSHAYSDLQKGRVILLSFWFPT